MASTTVFTLAREQILQLCRGDADTRTLRLEVLAVLRRVIGFDAYVWLVTDPETSVGSAPLADVPCLPDLPRLIRLKYLTPVNRWTSMTTPVASLHQATGGELARSLMWRELLCRYEIGDIATSVYRDRFGCWAFLDLWRRQGAPPFAAAELEFLHSIAGPLTTALRHSQAAAFAAGRSTEQASAGPVVLLLSPALDVRAQTPQTQEYLQLLIPPEARTRHRRQHREHHPQRPRLAVRPGLRAQFPRDGAAGSCRLRRGHPGHRPADVPVRAHGPGSPQGDLREDRHPRPGGPCSPASSGPSRSCGRWGNAGRRPRRRWRR